jgi:hypothetical protein
VRLPSRTKTRLVLADREVRKLLIADELPNLVIHLVVVGVERAVNFYSLTDLKIVNDAPLLSYPFRDLRQRIGADVGGCILFLLFH